ncbi:hypothetical protein [Tabrizicola sp.]|uniref:hypothetical protein n=1 Tax=Tabrizicola sp. TaxID=2005166 RepID=UPI002FDC8A4A
MIRNLLGAAVVVVTGSLPALAEDWSGQVTPYVWAAGFGGDITPFTGAPTLSFDKSFSDVVDDLDGAFFLSGYARRGELVFMGDLSWSSSSKSGLVPPGLPAEGKLTQRSLTLLAGWRAVNNQGFTLDLLGGARAWSIKSSVSVAGGLMQASPGKDFVDPILAARANIAMGPQWSAVIYADFGGFGVGSENTSQVLATVNYEVKDNLWLSFGYRQLNVDYRSGGTEVDVHMGGPLFGATWQF